MKNTKNMFLAGILLVSAGMMHAGESEYRFSGQAAVKHLTATGECRNCDLSNQDLRAAITAIHSKNNSWDTYFFGGRKTIDLTSAYLQDANLSGAQLFGANLSDANLSDANLTGANLSDANLSDANLTGANLTGANLSDANLSDAKLTGANLTGANLINVINLDKTTGYRPNSLIIFDIKIGSNIKIGMPSIYNMCIAACVFYAGLVIADVMLEDVAADISLNPKDHCFYDI